MYKNMSFTLILLVLFIFIWCIIKLARHLADYLLYLDKNETAYRSYFDWRFKPFALASLRSVQPWCNLCHKLLTENKVNHNNNNNTASSLHISALTNKSYDDIYSWWFIEKPCQPPIKPF
jgi:hypothetical protein